MSTNLGFPWYLQNILNTSHVLKATTYKWMQQYAITLWRNTLRGFLTTQMLPQPQTRFASWFSDMKISISSKIFEFFRFSLNLTELVISFWVALTTTWRFSVEKQLPLGWWSTIRNCSLPFSAPYHARVGPLVRLPHSPWDETLLNFCLHF